MKFIGKLFNTYVNALVDELCSNADNLEVDGEILADTFKLLGLEEYEHKLEYFFEDTGIEGEFLSQGVIGIRGDLVFSRGLETEIRQVDCLVDVSFFTSQLSKDFEDGCRHEVILYSDNYTKVNGGELNCSCHDSVRLSNIEIDLSEIKKITLSIFAHGHNIFRTYMLHTLDTISKETQDECKIILIVSLITEWGLAADKNIAFLELCNWVADNTHRDIVVYLDFSFKNNDLGYAVNMGALLKDKLYVKDVQQDKYEKYSGAEYMANVLFANGARHEEILHLCMQAPGTGKEQMELYDEVLYKIEILRQKKG